MIVVTTPTGHIGLQLVRQLLDAKEAVRVVARDRAKLAPEVRDRVDVVEGSLDDDATMMRALDGAESLFLVVPPLFATPDVEEYYLGMTRPSCRAVTRHGVRRVVTVSGIGRKVAAGAAVSPISAAFAKDAELERTGVALRALWCPGFMENLLRSLQSLAADGTFSFPSRGDVKMPRVATRDIAATGARLLGDCSWSGQGGVAVLGPEDLSLDDMAAVMSDVLGKPIRFQPAPAGAYKAQLVKYGASEAFADGLLAMSAAKDDGLDLTEPRTPENTHPHDLPPVVRGGPASGAPPLVFGVLGLFGDVGRARELQAVAVGIGHHRDPHAVADERALGVDPARAQLLVQRNGVAAHEADRHALARRDRLAARLNHERAFVEREPAPAHPTLRRPRALHHEPEPVDIETKRRPHVRDAEQRDRGLHAGLARHRQIVHPTNEHG